MKELQCELCGSTDIIKQDWVFVCQSYNTKYSLEVSLLQKDVIKI